MARDFQRRQRPVNRHWSTYSKSFLAFGSGTIAATVAAVGTSRETILRTRGNLYCQIDAVSAPGGLVEISLGMILVPEGTGTTVLWSPGTDVDAPWFWYDRFAVGYEEAVTDVIAYAGGGMYRNVMDSKAMRIVRNQEVQLVAENATAGTALAVNIHVCGRFLSQE